MTSHGLIGVVLLSAEIGVSCGSDGSGGVGDGGVEDDIDAMNPEDRDGDGVTIAPNVLVVLDRSMSMEQDNKAPELVLAIGAHSTNEFQASYDGELPAGATPMRLALEYPRTEGWLDDASDPDDASRSKNVLLVTDGQPNCAVGHEEDTNYSALDESVAPLSCSTRPESSSGLLASEMAWTRNSLFPPWTSSSAARQMGVR